MIVSLIGIIGAVVILTAKRYRHPARRGAFTEPFRSAPARLVGAVLALAAFALAAADGHALAGVIPAALIGTFVAALVGTVRPAQQ